MGDRMRLQEEDVPPVDRSGSPSLLSSLEFSPGSLTDDDLGEYACVAANAVGSSEARVELTGEAERENTSTTEIGKARLRRGYSLSATFQVSPIAWRSFPPPPADTATPTT